MSKAIPTNAKGVELGRYRIEAELGRGGMGVVYACMDEPLGRRVAVKTLSVGLLGRDREARMTRFKREVQALRVLDHPGILHIYDAGEADDPVVGWVLYYAMEEIQGETLSERLIRGGALDVGGACAVAAKCAEALGSAHTRGIVHRDVKPANIFLAEGGRVVVADFGVCKIEGGQEITRKDQMVGTPSYLAPEQILGLPVDARTDVFALGALCYVLITNTALRPQLDRAGLSKLAGTDDAANRARAIRNVQPGLPEVIAKALARDPKDRYADGAALAEALEPFASRVPEPFELTATPQKSANLDGMTHSAFTSATADGGPPPAALVPAEIVGGDTAVDDGAPPAPEPAPTPTKRPAAKPAATTPELATSAPAESTDRLPRRARVKLAPPTPDAPWAPDVSGRLPPPVASQANTPDPEAAPREHAPEEEVSDGGSPARRSRGISPSVKLAAGTFVGMFSLAMAVGLWTQRSSHPEPVAPVVEPTPVPEPVATPEPAAPTLPASCRPEKPNTASVPDTGALLEKATAAEKKGDISAALALWERGLAADPFRWEIHAGAARAYRKLGMMEKARAQLTCIMDLRPDSSEGDRARADLATLPARKR